MNRREFNTTLLGSGLASSLPITAVAQSATAASHPLLGWATAISRAQNRASPALLAQQLKIPAAQASALYSELLAKGIIRAPLAAGTAKAAQPIRYALSQGAAPSLAPVQDRAKQVIKAALKESNEEAQEYLEPPEDHSP